MLSKKKLIKLFVTDKIPLTLPHQVRDRLFIKGAVIKIKRTLDNPVGLLASKEFIFLNLSVG